MSSLTQVRLGGVDRSALVFPSEDPGPRPLVLAFHGKGGSSEGAAKLFRIQDAWPEAIVAYPQGLATANRLDPEGKRSGWQPKPGELDDRDLLFVDALLAEIATSYLVDRSKVYAVGHSNGARFVYVLWAARAHAFAAFAASASSIGPLATQCVPKSIFVVSGEKDRIIPFSSQLKMFDTLREVLGTDRSTQKVEELLTTEQGRDGAELVIYAHPGGHDFPRKAVPLILEFFRRHELK